MANRIYGEKWILHAYAIPNVLSRHPAALQYSISDFCIPSTIASQTGGQAAQADLETHS